MVDLDDSYTSDDDSSSSSNDTSTSNSSGGSSGGSSESGSAEPVKSEVDIDDRVRKSDLSQTSKEWADEYGDRSYKEGASGGLQTYIQRQKDEMEEFYQNMAEMGKDIASDGAQKFTLAHHAMILNMAHNRAGIKEILEEEFGKSEDEAINLTKILYPVPLYNIPDYT